MDSMPIAYEWSKDAFYAKAQRYVEKMIEQERSNWEFGFWAVLSLEFLIKAALSNISPALIANRQNWNNILYACGHKPNQSKFTPSTANINEILNGAESVLPGFTKEMQAFCVTQINKRNGELHSGSMEFDVADSSMWLPMYCAVCEVLVESIGETLHSLFEETFANEAKIHIASQQEETLKAVNEIIGKHRKTWEAKTDEEKESLKLQAKYQAARHFGHRVDCPSCGCVALMKGSAIDAPKTDIEDDMIVERQQALPSDLACTACGLKMKGHSKLIACGLGQPYTITRKWDAIEFFEIDIEEEMRNMYFEDNNE